MYSNNKIHKLSTNVPPQAYTSGVNGKPIDIAFKVNNNEGIRFKVDNDDQEYEGRNMRRKCIEAIPGNFRPEYGQLSLLDSETGEVILYYTEYILGMLSVLNLHDVDICVQTSHQNNNSLPLLKTGVMPFFKQIQAFIKETSESVDTIVLDGSDSCINNDFLYENISVGSSGIGNIKIQIPRLDTDVYLDSQFMKKTFQGFYPKDFFYSCEINKLSTEGEKLFSSRRPIYGTHAEFTKIIEKILALGPGTIWAPKKIENDALLRVGSKKILNPNKSGIYTKDFEEILYNDLLKMLGILSIFFPKKQVLGEIKFQTDNIKEIFAYFSNLSQDLNQKNIQNK